MTDKQFKAITILEESIKKIKNSYQCRIIFMDFLKKYINSPDTNNNKDCVYIISNKFKLKRKFYDLLLEYVKEHKIIINNRKNEVKLDAELYRFFNALKRKDYIHKESSYFPKSFRLISINPNPHNILNTNFTHLDTFAKEIKKFNTSFVEPNLKNLYIYLRLFNTYLFTKKMLQTILLDEVIMISKEKSVLIFDIDSFLNVAKTDKFYKTIVLDRTASFLYHETQHKKRFSDLNDKILFKDIDKYEEDLKEYKNLYLPNISMNLMKSINKTYYGFQNNMITATFMTKTISTVPLSIAEINKCYPNLISKKHLIKEEKFIINSIKRNAQRNKEVKKDNVHFELYELESLEEIMKNKKEAISFKNIETTIKNIDEKIKENISETHKIIYNYISYLLNRVFSKKIRISTFRNYIYTINKHLFNMIENINDIKDYEINAIIQRFENNSYSKNTMSNIKKSFKMFFIFVKKEGFKMDITSFLYPKSLIFKDEIDLIIKEIEKDHVFYNEIRQSSGSKLMLLQKKAIIILSFYSGLRKSEIRSRGIKDIYICKEEKKDVIYIDVNSEGLHKMKLKLKSKNAERRVKVEIENHNHLNIILEWFKLRNNLNNNSFFLFLNKKNKKISTNVIDESLFDFYNEIIKKVTKRWCSFHSLRHSYATYNLKKILDDPYNNKAHAFLEFTIQIGHQTSNTAGKSYIHFELIKLLS